MARGIHIPNIKVPFLGTGRLIAWDWLKLFRQIVEETGLEPNAERYDRIFVPWSAMYTPPATAVLVGSTKVASFATGVDNSMDGALAIPDRWIPESDIGLTAVWASSNTDTGNVRMNIDRAVGGDGDSPAAAATSTKTIAAPGTASKEVYTAFDDLSGAGLTAGDTLVFTFQREGTNVADTHTGSLLLLGLLFKFQVGGVGLVG